MEVKAQTGIRTDKDTLKKLKELAGDKSLGAYLRDLANGVVQEPVPVDALDKFRESMLKRLDKMDKTLERLEKTVSMLYDQGQDLQATSTAKRLELDALIDKLSETDPEIAKISDIGDAFLSQYRQAKNEEPIKYTEEEVIDTVTFVYGTDDDESESDEQEK